MSQSGNEAFTRAQDEPENDSVFDFLYHDVRRVGSFLAQFEDAGHLQQVTESEGATRGTKRGWKVAAAGSIPTVGSANLALERGPEKGGFQAAERVYDPLWTNARTLLDYLEEHDMLVRGLDGARIGQFVLIGGALMVLDLKMMKTAWENPAIKALMAAGETQGAQEVVNRAQRRAQGGQRGKSKEPSPIAVITALLTMLPHSLQGRLIGPEANVWCTLDESSIVGSPSDLILKHGPLLQGEWQMLGVLDAFPDGEAVATPQYAEMLGIIAGTPIGQLQVQMAPIAKQLLGRPAEACGVTPLLIFRAISA